MDIKQCTLEFLETSSLGEATKNSILISLKLKIDFVCKSVHKAAYQILVSKEKV